MRIYNYKKIKLKDKLVEIIFIDIMEDFDETR